MSGVGCRVSAGVRGSGFGYLLGPVEGEFESNFVLRSNIGAAGSTLFLGFRVQGFGCRIGVWGLGIRF